MDAKACDERYAATERVWSVGPNSFVEQHLAGLPPGVAVDLATGEGRNAIWLASLGWTVTAIDYSAVGVARGRSSGADVTWQIADVLDAPLPRGVDLVLIAYLQLPHQQMAGTAYDLLVRAVRR